MWHGAASIDSPLRLKALGTAAAPMPSQPFTVLAKPTSASQGASPELQEAAQRAFAVLRTATERLIATMPARQRPPVLMMTLHVWALSHGIASLFGRGDAARRSFP